MKEYKQAEVKFNNGNGALLCNGCGTVLKTGFNFKDRLYFCKKCRKIISIRTWKDFGETVFLALLLILGSITLLSFLLFTIGVISFLLGWRI